MSNITITNNDPHSVALGGEQFEDGLCIFAGADTFAQGTILARHTGNQKFQLYVKGGSSNGNGVPVAVLTYEVSATEATDVPVRALVKGDVKKERLVIDADGDDSNIDASVTDDLRNTGITPVETSQLGNFDNPAALGPGDS